MDLVGFQRGAEVLEHTLLDHRTDPRDRDVLIDGKVDPHRRMLPHVRDRHFGLAHCGLRTDVLGDGPIERGEVDFETVLTVAHPKRLAPGSEPQFEPEPPISDVRDEQCGNDGERPEPRLRPIDEASNLGEEDRIRCFAVAPGSIAPEEARATEGHEHRADDGQPESVGVAGPAHESKSDLIFTRTVGTGSSSSSSTRVLTRLSRRGSASGARLREALATTSRVPARARAWARSTPSSDCAVRRSDASRLRRSSSYWADSPGRVDSVDGLRFSASRTSSARPTATIRPSTARVAGSDHSASRRARY